MIRHADRGPPQSIGALTHPVSASACFRPLVAAPGRAELLLPGFQTARLAAVALPTVAMAADGEDGPTGTTMARSENNIGHDYPSSPNTLHQMIDDARLCGADDDVLCLDNPADVQKTTFSDDR